MLTPESLFSLDIQKLNTGKLNFMYLICTEFPPCIEIITGLQFYIYQPYILWKMLFNIVDIWSWKKIMKEGGREDSCSLNEETKPKDINDNASTCSPGKAEPGSSVGHPSSQLVPFHHTGASWTTVVESMCLFVLITNPSWSETFVKYR